MDDATIRRYLGDTRTTVLDIIDTERVRDADEVARVWSARRADLSPAHARRLPRMAAQLLWQLRNLGWIEQRQQVWVMTDLGRYARRLDHTPT
ncbi:hypothetical protein NQ152_12805 [Microbacterium sp. zg.B48]|uniref:hypothetical protein n=1 Tax=Microbacterium sp. zg.B48 TaxID=2969408 RepID=UPI00214C5A6A|nr:hypothetical protein [Microbacterium sp. zg.B48]MCR2764384.1 hypothetical protein [Microbacterium sp. zg.B48]